MSNLNDCSGFNKVNLDVKENWNNGVEHPVKFCHGGIDISLAEFRKDHPELSEDEIRENIGNMIFNGGE